MHLPICRATLYSIAVRCLRLLKASEVGIDERQFTVRLRVLGRQCNRTFELPNGLFLPTHLCEHFAQPSASGPVSGILRRGIQKTRQCQIYVARKIVSNEVASPLQILRISAGV